MKIITVPNPLLRQKSKPVLKISSKGGASGWDKRTLDLIKQLKKIVNQQEKVKGVGLSAIQIGVPKRVFIAYSPQSRKFLTFINPEIIWQSKRMITGVAGSKNKLESCFSVPGIWGLVKRHQVVKVRYQTLAGQTIIRRFRGFLGIIVQHEYDHLQGILFTDRVLEQKGKLYELKKDEEGKERLEEINLNKFLTPYKNFKL